MPRPRRTRAAGKSPGKSVEALRHEEDTRTNIPTAEYQSLVREEQESPLRVAYQRRNRDLDPQLVWRGKDEQDLADLVVNVPPLYIQEKVHPKALIADLVASSQWLAASKRGDDRTPATDHRQLDLFSDFNGLPEGADRTAFYQHEGYWQNRMILGDSLQVMASLSEREGLQGKVQCIYIDPPYGIRFNSNFQWSTTSRDVRDGNRQHITREPEQVKAFRDTWRDGIHSYLTYLRDRLTVARDLLAESGSIFVQIGDENVHRVRALMDEVFGEDNFCRIITIRKTAGDTTQILTSQADYILWAAKNKDSVKYRPLFTEKEVGVGTGEQYDKKLSLNGRNFERLSRDERSHPHLIPKDWKVYRTADLRRQGFSATATVETEFQGQTFHPGAIRQWKTPLSGLARLNGSDRLELVGNTLEYRRFFDDWPVSDLVNIWLDAGGSGFGEQKVYVVQTIVRVIQRCILMTTDPGDLVLDPTCGSGTTAYVAEQWGRRWITVDTSRVALALARARIMGARYPYYLLADSKEGQLKEAEITRRAPSEMPVYGNIRQGFVYQRVPHITLRAIANNAEIDVIWETAQEELEPLRTELNAALGRDYEEWEVPREPGDPWPESAAAAWLVARGPGNTDADKATALWVLNTELGRNYMLDGLPDQPRDPWEPVATDLHRRWWEQRIARQKEIDASIAARAEYEYLYDKPYEDRSKVRVAGPFTVESISPHRVLGVDENGEIIDSVAEAKPGYGTGYDFGQIILENLKRSGVQQAHKEDRITFTSLTPWPGRFVCASGQYSVASGQSPEGEPDTDHQPLATAGIFVGPEFGTVSRPDLVEAAREAAECGFDMLIACAFNYDAHTTEFESLGRIPVLKARMNADLHMAGELKNTGNGNLFVIFGEPDVSVASGQWLVDRNGRMVANIEHVKELSGLGSLEEINRLGRDGLSRLGTVSAGREIRNNQSGQAGGSVGSGEYRGGGGASRVEGVPEFSGDSQRVAGGNRDVPDAGTAAGDGPGGTGQAPAGPSARGWPDAERTQTLAAVQNLKAADFPLSLTTDHWTQITVNGVDVFHPNTGEVRSDGPKGIACWFIDTDYNQESFFVRHAYFLGANDPYKSLKTTLRPK